MHKLFKAALLGLVACTAMAGSAGAADIIPEPPMEPPVITTPPPVYEEISTGGWYLRGDAAGGAYRMIWRCIACATQVP